MPKFWDGIRWETPKSRPQLPVFCLHKEANRIVSIAVAYNAHRVGQSPVRLDTNYSIIEVQGHLTFSQVKVIEDLVKETELLVKVIEDLFKVI